MSAKTISHIHNGNHSAPREEFNITPSEETEFVEEKPAEEENEGDNPFENVDMETGEILTPAE